MKSREGQKGLPERIAPLSPDSVSPREGKRISSFLAGTSVPRDKQDSSLWNVSRVSSFVFFFKYLLAFGKRKGEAEIPQLSEATSISTFQSQDPSSWAKLLCKQAAVSWFTGS